MGGLRSGTTDNAIDDPDPSISFLLFLQVVIHISCTSLVMHAGNTQSFVYTERPIYTLLANTSGEILSLSLSLLWLKIPLHRTVRIVMVRRLDSLLES